jgi:hypothetical protein
MPPLPPSPLHLVSALQQRRCSRASRKRLLPRRRCCSQRNPLPLTQARRGHISRRQFLRPQACLQVRRRGRVRRWGRRRGRGRRGVWRGRQHASLLRRQAMRLLLLVMLLLLMMTMMMLLQSAAAGVCARVPNRRHDRRCPLRRQVARLLLSWWPSPRRKGAGLGALQPLLHLLRRSSSSSGSSSSSSSSPPLAALLVLASVARGAARRLSLPAMGLLDGTEHRKERRWRRAASRPASDATSGGGEWGLGRVTARGEEVGGGWGRGRMRRTSEVQSKVKVGSGWLELSLGKNKSPPTPTPTPLLLLLLLLSLLILALHLLLLEVF